MPVLECVKDGSAGFKWGPAGVCFIGADARERAAAVGRAIAAQKDEGLNVASVEEIVSKMDIESILWMDQLFPEPSNAPTPEFKMPGTVKKTDEELRIVWSEVYIPDFPDAHGDFMRSEEIRKMAHNFLGSGNVNAIDVRHDNVARKDCEIVESFIAQDGDPMFIPGSWVVGVRLNDDTLWEDAKSGVLNGFSMQARVFTKQVEIEVDIPPEVSGLTERSSANMTSGHRHTYTVRFAENGDFLGGQTDTVEGHFHRITRGSVTGPPMLATTGTPDGQDDHIHRYTFLDKLFGVPLDSEGRELAG